MKKTLFITAFLPLMSLSATADASNYNPQFMPVTPSTCNDYISRVDSGASNASWSNNDEHCIGQLMTVSSKYVDLIKLYKRGVISQRDCVIAKDKYNDTIAYVNAAARNPMRDSQQFALPTLPGTLCK